MNERSSRCQLSWPRYINDKILRSQAKQAVAQTPSPCRTEVFTGKATAFTAEAAENTQSEPQRSQC